MTVAGGWQGGAASTFTTSVTVSNVSNALYLSVTFKTDGGPVTDAVALEDWIVEIVSGL